MKKSNYNSYYHVFKYDNTAIAEMSTNTFTKVKPQQLHKAGIVKILTGFLCTISNKYDFLLVDDAYDLGLPGSAAFHAASQSMGTALYYPA